MLDWRCVPPGNLVDSDSEHGGNLLAFSGTRRPAAQGDRGDAALVEAATIGQLGDVEGLFATEFGN